MKTQPTSRKITALVIMFVMTSILAFATPTLLSTFVLPQNNAQISAGQLTFTLAACDNTNGNTFTATGREILIVQNTDASPHTFTITPVADPYGGTNTTLTAYSSPANSFSGIQMKYLIGWQTGSTIAMTCSSNLLKYAVLQTN